MASARAAKSKATPPTPTRTTTTTRRLLLERELNWRPPRVLYNYYTSMRASQLDLSLTTELQRVHYRGVRSLDVDPSECRYLLSGGADQRIAVFDLEPTWLDSETTPSQSQQFVGSRASATAGRSLVAPIVQQADAHEFSVDSVQWYPHDTGMFVTSSMDTKLKVWDTNTLEVGCVFQLRHNVYAHHLAPNATRHALIAAGTADQKVRLCDIRSGSFAQTLVGHRDTVYAVQWSPASEFLLATAGRDRRILFWDVRRTGVLHELDQHNHAPATSAEHTQLARQQQRLLAEEKARLKQSRDAYERALRERQSTLQSQHRPADRPGTLTPRPSSIPITSAGEIEQGSTLQQLLSETFGSASTSAAASSAASSRVAASGRGASVPQSSATAASAISSDHVPLAAGQPLSAASDGLSIAHSGAINGLLFSSDGALLYSTGTDNKVRCWDVMLGINTLVNYTKIRNQAKRGVRMALAGRAGGAGGSKSRHQELLFHPSDSEIGCYDAATGRQVKSLKAHMDVVNCCVFHPHRQELYTGSNDQQILVWSPPPPPVLDDPDSNHRQASALAHRRSELADSLTQERQRADLIFSAGLDIEDQWSDDE
ncbi:DNA repair helicase RAD25 [Capsaspora owczarzaki ATCC 30864]|uniref:DNA repair helicase RAD25 n=1 Tax=Capsaspora owczarzaki (strain ATCC 30864) TaxID=595528 RepID=A0A0D2X1H9_CAPO3|nr:DNA repair helicase RAD25 [Capsaspora owczarzaki ATCC 30864]KJE90839.1 DNA repair helicase RAD25 [Capsaspora owczarzaki ATCC 30864]|eukprot:XP_004348832.1 DNA repair helicase RAD25 [Capsaspora owczarzaki ATCC 30864]